MEVLCFVLSICVKIWNGLKMNFHSLTKMDISFLTVQVDSCSLLLWLGQIELFTHFSYVGDIAKRLTDFGFRLISLYLVSSWQGWWSLDGLPFYLWWRKVYLWKFNGTFIYASIRFTSSKCINKVWFSYCWYSWKVRTNILLIFLVWDCWIISHSFRFRFPDGDALLHRLNQKDSRRIFTSPSSLLESMYTRLNEALSELVCVTLLKRLFGFNNF